MAWLFIDTHESGQVRAAWLDGGKVVKRQEKEGRAAILLPLIAKDLEKMKLNGVCIVAGPGSFSAVRGGVLDANLIARLKGIPLVPVEVSAWHDLEGLAARIQAGEISTADYVAPIYDQEPNITTPKKLA